MSLIFGKLTQQFVSFGAATAALNPNNATSVADLAQSAHDFRHTAALDAVYLTSIGT